MRYCRACGYAIADPAITTCPRCGQPLGSDAAWQAPDAGSPSSYPPYGGSPAWPQMPQMPSGGEASAPHPSYPPASVPPPGYASPSLPFAGGVPPGPLYAPYAPYAPSTRPLYPQQPPPGYGYGGYPPSMEPGYPGNPGYPAYPGYPGYVAPPASGPRRGTAALIAVLIVTLLVVLVGGGAAIAHLASLPNSARTSAPPGAASATATTAAASGGVLLYQNSFSSDATGWSSSQHCFLGAGGYHVNTRACFAPIGDQTNVDVTVQVKQISGQTIAPYGLVLRADGPPSNSPDQRYDFDIDSNGKWVVFRCDGTASNGLANCTRLVDYSADDAIRGGLNVANTLEVKAQGPNFDFYINGVRVGSVSDTTYTSGKVGLNTGQDVECVFTNFTVKSLS